ncbi:DUF3040 domain-containing protein [Schaalia sp. 19OD2882]|uniref:DUF3040 domain-containing protein n=1 Tax=Schaalia sp. 19OD2882 TaxID=2794089 RepID=UPI001C1EC9C3|nr:DUF3040 domain-containing protein [Schaalia sp. 19OD2882]QWW20700.1 DUF3040 domain-containing protein [Schaalia sp. 19OD2882]
MALSDYEKQVLEEMEAELRRVDPDLAHQMSKGMEDRPSGSSVSRGEESATGGESGPLSPRRIALGVVMVAVGLAALVGAVSLGVGVTSIVLGVAAFLLMLGGVLFALRPGGAGNPSSRKPRGRRQTSAWARFIADQERRWEERRDS